MGKLHLWWVLKLQAKQVTLLSCSRRVLSCLIIPHTMQLSIKPTFVKPPETIKMRIFCNIRFEPLTEENLISDDLDMLENEIQAVDTGPGDTGQISSSFINEQLQVCDKFDIALLKKLTLMSLGRQKTALIMLHAKIKWENPLGLYPLALCKGIRAQRQKIDPYATPYSYTS